MTQAELYPSNQTATVELKAAEADAAVERLRQLGGVLLSFSPVGGGKIKLNVLLPPAELAEQWQAENL